MKRRSPLVILFFTLFIDMLGFGLILPLMPVYIRHYGGAPWVSGALMACFSVTQFIFSPIWGRASDKYGRRPIILISLIGSALSYLSFGLASNLTMLFIARVACGVLTSASLPTSQAYITDVTTPEKRSGGMAVLGAAFGLGFAFGPIIGGYFSKFALFGLPSLATPAIVASAMAALNFIAACFLLPESLTDREKAVSNDKKMLDVFVDVHRALRNPRISKPIAVFTFLTFAFAAVESSFSWMVILRFHNAIEKTAIQNFALARPSENWASAALKVQQDFIEKAQAGASTGIFIVVGITILLTQGAVMSGLARRIGENRLVCFGLGLLVFAMIGIAIAPSLQIIMALSACIAIGSGVSNPSLSALIMQSAKHEDRGLISGAQQGLSSLARIFAPPVNNTLVGINTAYPFVCSAILMAVSFFLSLGMGTIKHSDGEAEAPISMGH